MEKKKKKRDGHSGMLMNMWDTTLVFWGGGGAREKGSIESKLRGWRDGEREGEEREKQDPERQQGRREVKADGGMRIAAREEKTNVIKKIN